MTRWIPAAVLAAGLPLSLAAAQQTRSNQPAALPKPTGSLYVATFIDLMPQTTAAGTAVIRQYVADSRKDPGLVRVEAIAQDGRENHLVIVEVWQDQSRFDAHEAAAHTRDYRAKLLPLIGAPFDQRLHHLVP